MRAISFSIMALGAGFAFRAIPAEETVAKGIQGLIVIGLSLTAFVLACAGL